VSDRVTIKSIAQDLGVSHMTVSRALSGHPNVRADLRRSIRDRAAALGYVRSAAASVMRGDGARVVGLLLPGLVNEFYARFADAFGRCCEDLELHLTIHLTNDDAERERLSIRRLRELEGAVVVMVPTPGVDGSLDLIPANMRVIHLIRQRSRPRRASSLLVDDGVSISEAVSHLVRTGHERIAYIGAGRTLSSGRERLRSYTKAMRAHGLDPDPALVRTGSPSFEMGRTNALSVVRGTKPASALVCGGFEISNGALDACLCAGLSLPEDLAFIGYGDPSFYRWIQGGISTVALPVDELARVAASMLSPGNAASAPRSNSLPTSLVLRGSG